MTGDHKALGKLNTMLPVANAKPNDMYAIAWKSAELSVNREFYLMRQLLILAKQCQ